MHDSPAPPAPPAHPTPGLAAFTPYLLSKVGRTARARVGDRLAARGLRMWHMAVLSSLAADGPQPQRDLATRLAVHPSDMAKVLDELTRAGWVDRERDSDDRRRITATLTAAGRTALAELEAEVAAVQDALLAPLDADERNTLHRLLLRLHTATG
ncbi:MarR family winged helix-turn-helix transcriptional regulator [Streptomyces sp. NPDC101206]|uniref:MarR family winged helix-turn-helix transcriptional regulator n=1 Tax=Streptomyces sp. NPDC101206 TaxID=3366128 RepID=UPI003824D773